MADMLLGGIVINEILVDPLGAPAFDTDGNGTANSTDEYVELFNASAGAIDISGVQLWDQGIGNWFTFPAGTILQPGGHAMVMSGVQAGGSLPTGGPDDLFFDVGRGSAVINNTGDNVTLYDPANDEFVQAVFDGDPFDDPTTYSGFSPTATQVGAGEDFGTSVDGESLQRTGDGSDTFASTGPTAGTTNVCFADGSHIATTRGDIAVEDLQVGDLVVTADNGAQPIKWLFHKTWSADQVATCSSLAAVLIRAGALGIGCPSRDLRVSQQHRILVRGQIATRMFGSDEVLIPAKALLDLAGVSLDVPETSVSYYHVMLDAHQVIFANGVAAESLFLGAQAIASIPKACLDEICTILDMSLHDLQSGTAGYAPARELVPNRRATKLVERHIKNGRSVV